MEMDPPLCRVLSEGLWEIFAPLLSDKPAPKRQLARVKASPISER